MTGDAEIGHALEDALAALARPYAGLPPARGAGMRATRLLMAVAARHSELIARADDLDAEAGREARRREVADRALAALRDGPVPGTDEEARAMAAALERVARAIARDRDGA